MSINENSELSPEVQKTIKDIVYLLVLKKGVDETRRLMTPLTEPILAPMLDEIAKPLDEQLNAYLKDKKGYFSVHSCGRLGD